MCNSVGKDKQGTRVPSPSFPLTVGSASALFFGKREKYCQEGRQENRKLQFYVGNDKVEGVGMGMGEPSQNVGLWDVVSPLLVSVATDGGCGDPQSGPSQHTQLPGG